MQQFITFARTIFRNVFFLFFSCLKILSSSRYFMRIASSIVGKIHFTQWFQTSVRNAAYACLASERQRDRCVSVRVCSVCMFLYFTYGNNKIILCFLRTKLDYTNNPFISHNSCNLLEIPSLPVS